MDSTRSPHSGGAAAAASAVIGDAAGAPDDCRREHANLTKTAAGQESGAPAGNPLDQVRAALRNHHWAVVPRDSLLQLLRQHAQVGAVQHDAAAEDAFHKAWGR
jgi:hypothetical protein